MSVMFVLEAIGLAVWTVIALCAARWVQATYVRANDRDLTTPSVRETFGGERITCDDPIWVRSPLTVAVSYSYAAVAVIVAVFWLVTQWQLPVVGMLIVGVTIAGAMFRWLLQFNEAEEARTAKLHALRIGKGRYYAWR